mmetsp:Transcript_28622/g.77508  ORF Transcript_28622/g.77508 Transcript_28622/m.77508 type:complete len:258 (-) Transcript_28622:42-815(-)|eukprot:CAMPEP_0172374136 /NCGR_PEP_ID=MMETSP1060-20121228/54595_1 /TAXON_ID=37318 /ORGANISM="Pseudo-nitzschia pungens, Strain cf. cingulata" /LENGTH=257 /DNA_ID=CAMNT_0013100697 /DNA_START=98 /DNA_END=871 /DNA_ORIENTATION=+
MMIVIRFLFLFASIQIGSAFLSNQEQRSIVMSPMASSSSLSMAAMSYEEMLQRVDNYEVTVPKPMGVIFGENPDPYLGLVVDDVSEGMNGGRAGLRVGDQLLAINEQVVIGRDFDTVMEKLQEQPKNLNLVLYRGPVGQLFTVLSNQLGEGQSLYDDGDDYNEDDSEEIIMDENYETPVRIEVKEQKPLTPGDFVKAFGKLGSMLGETLTSSPDQNSDVPPPPKKKSGFFGIGAEAVQLEGEDAQGYRREKIEPDDF